jgi:hypothetical protein
MQLVLVAGFKASAGKVGPKVRLFEGTWRIVAEGLVDSELALRNDSTKEANWIENGTKFASENEIFDISVLKAGTEPFINVFAEYINGSNSPKPA